MANCDYEILTYFIYFAIRKVVSTYTNTATISTLRVRVFWFYSILDIVVRYNIELDQKNHVFIKLYQINHWFDSTKLFWVGTLVSFIFD